MTTVCPGKWCLGRELFLEEEWGETKDNKIHISGHHSQQEIKVIVVAVTAFRGFACFSVGVFL